MGVPRLMWSRPAAWRKAWIWAACLLLWPAGPATAAELNYYEWSAVARIVVAGQAVPDDGFQANFAVERVLRGDLQPGQLLRVDLRQANRQRNVTSHPKPLHLEQGRSYVLLLESTAGRKADRPALFRLVRGVSGARELPAEGAPALLGALQRFVAMHEQNDDRHTWNEFAEMLKASDPVIVETALSQFIKFRRGDPGLLPSVRLLLQHSSPLLRERSARLIGQILARRGGLAVPEAPLLHGEILACARRDPEVAVRVAATEALHALDGETCAEILREISATDPDQQVRYTAERLIFEREQAQRQPRANGTGVPARRD